MLSAFTELRLGPPTPSGACTLEEGESGPLVLRTEPANVCRSKARELFNVNGQYRPQAPVCNRLEIGEHLVKDASTGLTWSREASRFPLNCAEAAGYIERLNEQSAHGIDCWRLPTVNELLSLLADGDVAPLPLDDGLPVHWFWSCDKHGKHESWYVNMDMGYAGVQDVNCLNHVRAVARPQA